MVTTTRTRSTVQDYLKLPDEPRVELFDGEYYVIPAPLFPHQNAVTEIARALRGHVKAQRLGVVVAAPFDVILSEHDVVQPDLVFIAEDHRDRIRGQLHGVPDLVVEVVSPTHAERDRIVKRDLYARFRVPEYWIVDTEERTVEVLVFEEDAWRLTGIFQPGDTLASPCFPDLDLPVAEIFE